MNTNVIYISHNNNSSKKKRTATTSWKLTEKADKTCENKALSVNMNSEKTNATSKKRWLWEFGEWKRASWRKNKKKWHIISVCFHPSKAVFIYGCTIVTTAAAIALTLIHSNAIFHIKYYFQIFWKKKLHKIAITFAFNYDGNAFYKHARWVRVVVCMRRVGSHKNDNVGIKWLYWQCMKAICTWNWTVHCWVYMWVETMSVAHTNQKCKSYCIYMLYVYDVMVLVMQFNC